MARDSNGITASHFHAKSPQANDFPKVAAKAFGEQIDAAIAWGGLEMESGAQAFRTPWPVSRRRP
jgi:hypothetical protein